MKFIKNFENHAAYETYVATDYPKPNVSYCAQENEVHYKTFVPPPPFFCKLTLNEGDVVELEGNGKLTSAMISPYKSGLVSAEIGTLCTSIGINAFNECMGLISINIQNTVTSIVDSAFAHCYNLTSVTIPSSVTSIGDYAFFNCTSLSSITIPDGVTSIGRAVFDACSSLTSITIPDGVTSIGESAFSGCTSLTSITIPDGVTSIGESAFYGCSDFASITINATTPPTLGSGAFGDTNNCPIYVPSESVDTYKAASGWSTYATRIQAKQ